MWTVVMVVGRFSYGSPKYSHRWDLFEFYFPLAVTFDSGGFFMSATRQKSGVVPVG